MQIIYGDTPSDQTLSDLLSGDSVLWVTDTHEFDPSAIESIGQLIRVPWRGVFLESSSPHLAAALSDSSAEKWADDVGFMHLISNNPTSLVLQRRARPVFFLNGRADMSGSDSATLAGRSATLRRLNMIARLRDLEAKRVVIVGPQPEVPLEELADLWGTEFRALVTVVSEDRSQADGAVTLLNATTDLDAINWIIQSTIAFADAVSKRASTLIGAVKLLVNVALPSGLRVDVDLAKAELVEHPLSDACDFIRIRDTLPVSPRDLTLDEFRGFFTRSEPNWRAFSAGLPWIPDTSPEKRLRDGLGKLLLAPPGTMQLFSVVSEPGAGGTTQACALAFAAAKDGFPVLLVKRESEVPSSLELTSFMFRANSAIQAAHGQEDQEGEPVWLIVLDVQHFDGGTEELWRLWADLQRSGRRIAVLKVVDAGTELQPPKSISNVELAYVNHDLDFETVANLGAHLNGFLRHLGEEKSKDEWRAFWETHRPDIDTGIASFWIALEFWLAGYLELGESIQSWVLRQFKASDASFEVKQALLEIAAFSIERRAMPERLLAPLGSPRLPWAQVLENARRQSPGLGMLQAQSVPYGRVWAITHDVLARYLINAVWNDRLLAHDLAVDNQQDPVSLRLELISRVAHRTSIGDAFARPFAVNLATQILKLDEQFGNAEFFPHWRRVLSLLESVPPAIKNGSRTFNHHLAISRRRITQGEIFQVSPVEKRDLLLHAADEVRFALDSIDATPDDESDLNLLNTLALLYQDLAALERVAFGDKSLLAKYLAMSDEVTRRALKGKHPVSTV